MPTEAPKPAPEPVVADPNVPVPHTTVLPSDIDAQGNVTVWDHGPLAPVGADGNALPAEDPRAVAAAAEASAWHDRYGAGPVPVVMHNADASHAISVEPARWSIEPLGFDDGDVNAEVERLQAQRAASKKMAEDQAKALELAADRKQAVATVMAARAAKAAADKAEKVQAARANPPPLGFTPAPAYSPGGLPSDPPVGTLARGRDGAPLVERPPYPPGRASDR
jgi:hypothetical protein